MMINGMEGRWLENEPLSRHSSLRIGGPARVWVDVHTNEELVQVMELASAQSRPIVLVGLGSNTLFPDEGIDGFVIRLGGTFSTWSVAENGDDAVIHVGAGVVNAHLVRGLLREGWVGMEFLSLIPGTFGGAVTMNAGTREKDLSQILEHVNFVVPREPGTVRTMTASELDISYRHCAFPYDDAVVVGGSISVTRGDVDEASRRVKADKDGRNRTQPYRLASVGSTFANPSGDYAGRLIEAAGLKGRAIGGARISELHANFFINESDASAEDFLRLMALARVEVRHQFGVELRPEVQFVGFDGWARLAALENEAMESR